jgi:hypothetical protein
MNNPTSHSSIFISPTIIGRIKLNLGTREGKTEDILIRFREHTNSRQVLKSLIFTYMQIQGCYTRCLGTSRGSSRHSSSTTSPTPRVWVPRHVARSVTGFVVDYSVRRNFLLRPHWLYFSHTVRRDYLSRGNTGSTSSTPHTASTSSSGRIALTIHLD